MSKSNCLKSFLDFIKMTVEQQRREETRLHKVGQVFVDSHELTYTIKLVKIYYYGFHLAFTQKVVYLAICVAGLERCP